MGKEPEMSHWNWRKKNSPKKPRYTKRLIPFTLSVKFLSNVHSKIFYRNEKSISLLFKLIQEPMTTWNPIKSIHELRRCCKSKNKFGFKSNIAITNIKPRPILLWSGWSILKRFKCAVLKHIDENDYKNGGVLVYNIRMRVPWQWIYIQKWGEKVNIQKVKLWTDCDLSSKIKAKQYKLQ